MTERVREHPAAGAELLEAADFYERLVPGLGHELITRIADSVRSIATRPQSWPPIAEVHGGATVRSRSVRSFPYRVVFMMLGYDVYILAYVHERRHPDHWRDRVADPYGE